jgi:HSP20 family protein
MERAFEQLTGKTLRQLAGTAYPAVNLWEEDERFLVEAELPGLAIDDLEIYVDSDNQLTLKGERKAPEHEEVNWHRQERGFGRFSRTLELPSEVDADQVSAEFKYGVLTITLPKKAEVKPRRVEVQVG